LLNATDCAVKALDRLSLRGDIAAWGHLDHAGGAEDIRKDLDIPVIGPHKDDQFWMDHAGGAEDIRKDLAIPVIGPHKDDQFWMDTIEQAWAKYGHAGMGKNIVPDRYLEDGETLTLGGVDFGVVHTPGHTPGHVVIYNQDMKIA